MRYRLFFLLTFWFVLFLFWLFFVLWFLKIRFWWRWLLRRFFKWWFLWFLLLVFASCSMILCNDLGAVDTGHEIILALWYLDYFFFVVLSFYFLFDWCWLFGLLFPCLFLILNVFCFVFFMFCFELLFTFWLFVFVTFLKNLWIFRLLFGSDLYMILIDFSDLLLLIMFRFDFSQIISFTIFIRIFVALSLNPVR